MKKSNSLFLATMNIFKLNEAKTNKMKIKYLRIIIKKKLKYLYIYK